MKRYQDANRGGGQGSFPQSTPTREMSPSQRPSSGNRGNLEYVVLENIPRGLSGSLGGSSIPSLPNVPSPLSGPTPSILSCEPEHRQRLLSSSRRVSNGGSHNGEEDTFVDDRSLEHRIHRTLGNAPQPLYLDTPSSVPVTPNARLSAPRSHWKSNQKPQFSPARVRTVPETDDPDALRTHQSAMAIQELRQELQNAQHNLRMIQQEKETAESEVESLKQSCQQLDQKEKEAQAKAEINEQQRVAAEKDKEDAQNELRSRVEDMKKVAAERNTMEAAVAQLSQEVETLRGENQELSSKLEDATKGNQSEQDEKDLKLQELQKTVAESKSQHETDQVEIVRLRNALKEATKSANTARTNETNIQLNSMKEANEVQQRKMEELGNELDEARKSLKAREAELRLLKQKLEETHAAKQSSRGGGTNHLGVALEEAHSLSPLSGVAGGRTKTLQAGRPIADRLSRIRDASERACLVKDHQREVARLKLQHESKIKALGAHHEQELETAVSAVKAQLITKHKGALETMRTDFATRTATLEKRHKKEIERLQEEMNNNAKLADESLAVAMSKVNFGKQRIEREMTKRDQLQVALSQLEEQHVSEKKRLLDQHEDEVKTLKNGWENEKAILLDLIQRDCNQVFEKQRTSLGIVSHRHQSPRSVQVDISTVGETQGAIDNHSPNSTPLKAQLDTPARHKIDDELRETEALVQSLLFGSSS